MLENNPSSHKRKVSDQFPKEKSIKVFKRLIIITTVVFSFGGLGFGFALRYSNIFQIHQSNNVPFTNFSD
ncbi:hypothetical protein GM3709_603 [Geminocystis sp. NIES-3709]|nr:hypothetical protein GM3709_603 [Geminocystis sp. NIES-3709]